MFLLLDSDEKSARRNSAMRLDRVEINKTTTASFSLLDHCKQSSSPFEKVFRPIGREIRDRVRSVMCGDQRETGVANE